MTKRKTPTKQALQASTESVESIEVKSNTNVAAKPKKANSTTTGASKRTRSKKVEAEKPVPPEGKVVPEVTYVAPNRAILVSEPPPSLYDRFVGWLFRITYNFRDY